MVQTSKVCVGETLPWVRIPLSPNLYASFLRGFLNVDC